MARFNSITGRAALSAQGAHAVNRLHRANGWQHQKRIGARGRLTRSRQRASRQLALLVAQWPTYYGMSLLDYILARDAGLLDPPDSPRSKKGK